MPSKPVPSYPLQLALQATAAIIRVNGYVSKKVSAETGAKPTSEILGAWLKSPDTSTPTIEDADVSEAASAEAWLTKLLSDLGQIKNPDSFSQSLSHLLLGGYRNVDSGFITKSDFGFVACVYPSMSREIVRKKNKDNAAADAENSEYIGTLKSRGEFFVKLLTKQYSNQIGCYIYKIKDRKGNLGVFFSSDSSMAENGECFLAKMTPKRHSVNNYHGGKETVFNRVKIVQNVGAAG